MLDEMLQQVQQMFSDDDVTGPESVPEDSVQVNKAESLAELQHRFRDAEDYRSQYDDKATERYKKYVGYREPVADGRSNLHIPRSYEQLDTLRARLVKAFVSSRPYVDFMPQINPRSTVEGVNENEQKADVAGALVDMQLERNSFKSVLYDYVTSMLIFPAAVMAIGWKYDMKNVRRKEPVYGMVFGPDGFPIMDETGQPLRQMIGTQIVDSDELAFDDNEVMNVDFYDFWPDPRGRNMDNCRYVFHREWLTREQIEERLSVLERANAGVAFELDWEALRGAGSGLEEGKWERLTAVGLSPDQRQDDWDGETGPGTLYEVLNYWEDERYALMVNRSEIAYDGPNPYWRHSKKPFVATSFEPLPGEFYGMSGMQLIEHLQEEINTHRNQRIDNVSFVLNRMWRVRRGADIDEEELVSRPHGIIHVDNPDDVTDFSMNDITGSSYTEEQIAKTDMENTLGVPSVVRGADSARRETATEIVTKSNNAGLRFDVKILLFESLGFKRMAYLMDLNNQQFIDTERVVRLLGEEGSDQWKAVSPSDIIGEYDYRPAGSSVDPAANKELRRAQLSEAMQMAHGMQNPYVDIYQLTRTWLESFDLRNTDKLLKTKEELQQEQYEQMVMQAMAEQEAQQRHQQQQMEAEQQQMQAQQQQQMEAEQQHQAMHEQELAAQMMAQQGGGY